jgi:hypothetical protein
MRVYVGKLRSDGDEVFLSASRIGTAYFIPAAIGEFLHKVTNGFVLVAVVLGAFCVSLARHISCGSSRLLIVALVSLAALFSLAEGFVMYSIFVGIYYSILLYFVFFGFLLLVQAAADIAAREWFWGSADIASR